MWQMSFIAEAQRDHDLLDSEAEHGANCAQSDAGKDSIYQARTWTLDLLRQ